MKGKRFNEEQSIGVLKGTGQSVRRWGPVCCSAGFVSCLESRAQPVLRPDFGCLTLLAMRGGFDKTLRVQSMFGGGFDGDGG